MSDVRYDAKEIHSYLLGSLPPAAVERLDELSLTDDAFADALAAAENDLVDSYVNDELSRPDRKLFENHYMKTNSGRSKTRFANSFREYGARAASADVAPSTAAETEGVFASVFGYLRWGLAAAATAAVVFGAWWFFPGVSPGEQLAGESVAPVGIENSNEDVRQGSNTQINSTGPSTPELATAGKEATVPPPGDGVVNDPATNTKKPTIDKPQMPRVFAFSLTPQLRSGSQISEISVPNNIERATARLELEPFDFDSYQIVLFDPSNQQIWRSGTVRPTGSAGRRTLVANVPARYLRAGNYRFAVSGLHSSAPPENVGDYPFKVVR